MWYHEYLEARTKKKDNLKPCPFCGAMPKYGNWAGGGAVWCNKCGAKISRDHEKGEEIDDFVLGGDIAADAWNRRADLYVGGVGGRYYKAPNSIEEVIIEGEKDAAN